MAKPRNVYVVTEMTLDPEPDQSPPMILVQTDGPIDLALEVSWETLERAGRDIARAVAGRNARSAQT